MSTIGLRPAPSRLPVTSAHEAKLYQRGNSEEKTLICRIDLTVSNATVSRRKPLRPHASPSCSTP